MEVTPTSDQLSSAPVREHSDSAKPTGGGKFGQILGAAMNMAGQLASSVGGAQTLGLGPIAGSLAGGLNGSGGIGGGLGGNDPSGQFEQLLQLQEQIQIESETFTAQTNISKTHYESAMSAIRNIRGG